MSLPPGRPRNQPWGRRRFLAAVAAWVALLALAAVVGVTAFSVGQQAGAEPESIEASAEPLAVEAVAVQRQAGYRHAIEFVGTVEAARESGLSFELGGLVKSVLVDEGDEVGTGQPIAVLDTVRLQAERAVQLARLAAAQAQLDELVSGPRQEQIEAQQREVERLVAELKRQQLSRDRKQELLTRKAVSVEEYEEVLYAAEATAAALSAAEVRLKELENGTRVEQIEAQRAVVAGIRASIDRIDVDLTKSTLRAPFAGVITDRHVDEGQVMEAGTPVVTVIEITHPEVRVGVDAATAADLRQDQSFDVRIGESVHAGTIKAIRRDVRQATRTVDVLIALDPGGATIRRGQLASVQIARHFDSPGFWLPLGALTEGNRGLWSAYVAQPTREPKPGYRLQRRDLEILHAEADRVFVRGAVADGERVVLSGTHRLVPGLQVRVVEPQAPLRRPEGDDPARYTSTRSRLESRDTK